MVTDLSNMPSLQVPQPVHCTYRFLRSVRDLGPARPAGTAAKVVGWGSCDDVPEQRVLVRGPDVGKPSTSIETRAGHGGVSACPVHIAQARQWTSTELDVSACPVDIADAERCDAVITVDVGIGPRRDSYVQDIGVALAALGLNQEEDEKNKDAETRPPANPIRQEGSEQTTRRFDPRALLLPRAGRFASEGDGTMSRRPASCQASRPRRAGAT
jgi:hypothetical protein